MNFEALKEMVRPELRPYMIAFCDYEGGRGWLKCGNKTIANARDEYDAGYADITSVRVMSRPNKLGIFGLLCIPRVERAVIGDVNKFSRIEVQPAPYRKARM